MINSQLSLIMFRTIILFFKNIIRVSKTIIISLSKLFFLTSCLCTNSIKFSFCSLFWTLWTITDELQIRCNNNALSRNISSLRKWSEIHLWIKFSIRNLYSRRWKIFMISFVILSNWIISKSRSNSESISCFLKRFKNEKFDDFESMIVAINRWKQ